jgi:membrane-bound lytic murein transglycosylase MltF
VASLVTGLGPRHLRRDLAGREIGVRASSSYRASLDTLSRRFVEQGLPAIRITDLSEALEDEDILEMVSTGLLPWAVVDDYKAKAWTQVFDNLTVRATSFCGLRRIGHAFGGSPCSRRR